MTEANVASLIILLLSYFIVYVASTEARSKKVFSCCLLSPFLINHKQNVSIIMKVFLFFCSLDSRMSWEIFLSCFLSSIVMSFPCNLLLQLLVTHPAHRKNGNSSKNGSSHTPLLHLMSWGRQWNLFFMYAVSSLFANFTVQFPFVVVMRLLCWMKWSTRDKNEILYDGW